MNSKRGSPHEVTRVGSEPGFLICRLDPDFHPQLDPTPSPSSLPVRSFSFVVLVSVPPFPVGPRTYRLTWNKPRKPFSSSFYLNVYKSEITHNTQKRTRDCSSHDVSHILVPRERTVQTYSVLVDIQHFITVAPERNFPLFVYPLFRNIPQREKRFPFKVRYGYLCIVVYSVHDTICPWSSLMTQSVQWSTKFTEDLVVDNVSVRSVVCLSSLLE